MIKKNHFHVSPLRRVESIVCEEVKHARKAHAH